MGLPKFNWFVNSRDEISSQTHRLRETKLVIDVSNLIYNLMDLNVGSSPHNCGGDMTHWASTIELFVKNLRLCEIEPIFVFFGGIVDPTQTDLADKLVKKLEAFDIARKLVRRVPMPITTMTVVRDVAERLKVKKIQCINEPDSNLARIARVHECPVLTTDSDCKLMDIPFGVVDVQSLEWSHVRSLDDSNRYIECKMYLRDNFLKIWPNLDLGCMPLVSLFVRQPPIRKIRSLVGGNPPELYDRVFTFLEGKTREDNIKAILAVVPPRDRRKTEILIESRCDFYDALGDSPYSDDLERTCRKGYMLTFPNATESDYQIEISSIRDWLVKGMEESTMDIILFWILDRTIMFFTPVLEDRSLPSVDTCAYQPVAVLLQLLRPHQDFTEPLEIYDRFGQDYAEGAIDPLKELKHYGPIDHLIWDIMSLEMDKCKRLLLATFECSVGAYEHRVEACEKALGSKVGSDLPVILMLMDYIDQLPDRCPLTQDFRTAAIMTYLYYTPISDSNRNLVDSVRSVLKSRETSTSRRDVNYRLVHQINQLQASIQMYNVMNGLLRDSLPTIQLGKWFNATLIHTIARDARILNHPSIQIPEILIEPLAA